MAPAVNCEGLVHIYKTREVEVVALQGLDLTVEQGEVVAIVGRSGSGKTTLMNILAGTETPTAGAAVVSGHDLTRMGERERDTYRSEVVGYTIQHSQANLATDLDALENILLPMGGGTAGDRLERAGYLLDAMGISHLAHQFPGELSGGEAQRLAVAIAMANRPRLLLADEPTSELDRSTAKNLLRDLRALLRSRNASAVIVTHDSDVERHADRVIQIRDGRTSTETRWREEQGSYIADELLIMDRAGRVQLPRRFVEHHGLAGRVRAHLEGDEIRIRAAEKEGE
jgi:putative ABC transport system ATP-binding protein